MSRFWLIVANGIGILIVILLIAWLAGGIAWVSPQRTLSSIDSGVRQVGGK